MLNYSKGKLNYKIFKNEEVSFTNDDDTFSIVLLTEMPLDLYINFQPVNIGKSNIIFLSPGETLMTKSKTKECKAIQFKKGSISVSENLIYLLFNTSLGEGGQSKSIHTLRKSNGPRILEYFSQLETSFIDEVFNEHLKLSSINCIIYECVYDTLFGDHREIVKFSNLLNSNYNKMHLVSQYADILKLPPKELLRAFKKRGYEKPSEIIKDRILLEVKKLLINTDLDIKEVGSVLGFEDPAYFARFFKKNTGETALEFREKYLKHQV